MQTKNDSTINSVLSLNDVSYAKTARPAEYIEVFEGSIYEWQADTVNATWNRIDCSILNLNFQQGQSKTVSAQVSIELFRNSGGQLEYNYDTGIYTSTTGLHLSKGYLIRAYTGYCENEAPYTEHVKLRFTGIIESILPNDDGIIEVNGVDFSVIFMNALNYNYPDINSYRDLPWEITSAQLAADIDDSAISFNVLNNSGSITLGAKIKIDSEIMLVLDVSVAGEITTLTVQRLSGVSMHLRDTYLYTGDEFLVMPDDVYNNGLLNKYVPAYDNWRLDYALRDLCIKSKFPLGLFSIAYNDSSTIRLGRSDKYPYMQSKSIFEKMAQSSAISVPIFDNEKYDKTSSISYTSVVERKVYAGIDEELLNGAKFKLEFGQSLWDCILSLVDGFGFKVFFNESGVLVIKSIRQYEWLAPYNISENAVEIIENHVWSWEAWDIASHPSKRYTFLLTSANIPTVANIRNLKVRFISNSEDTDSAYIQLRKNNSGTWQDVGLPILIPALKKYQYYESEIYRAATSDTIFIEGEYGIEMVSSPSEAPYFNGLMYLDTNDEVICFECDSTTNAIISSAVNSAAEVRNQMTVIGLPESPQPIISKSVDTSSIYGGKNIIKGGWTGKDSFVSSDHPFMDGRYDKYELFKGTDGLGVRVYSLKANWNLIHIAFKPQTTPIGETIWVTNSTGTEVICGEHIITDNDLTSFGVWLKIPKTYNESMVRIYSSIDLYVSEIECFESDPSFNFVGHLKETIVIKKNISDKATSDWISLTQLEMHRRNVKQFQISSLSNPYIEIGDCIVVSAPEVGLFNDTRVWVTGIGSEISRVGAIDNLTVVALPPMQSYIKPPDPTPRFLTNSAHGFSISRKSVETNQEIGSATEFEEHGDIKTAYNLDASQTNISVFCQDEFSISPGQLVQIDSEFMLVSHAIIDYDVNIGNWYGALTVIRGSNYTIASTHVEASLVIANKVCTGFQPPNEYLTFNFALTRPQKVQIVVGILHRNHTLAYVMEEKILDAGVYKRENGIRWDGGINFAKVWPESVNKIYLMPNDSFNYMYNRMFHIGATASWEDPKFNYYLWNFDQDITANYPNAGSASATSAGWSKTPSQYDASLIIKPVLNGFSGSISIVKTEKKTISIKTICPTYKLKWQSPIPLDNHKSSFQPVSIPIKISKDGADEYINDAVYFDAYVCGEDGSNINFMNASNPGPETARRWVSPIGLNQIIQWDFTDSQGKMVKTAASPGYKYKAQILNVFDIYGEGVEVIKDNIINLIDGRIKTASNSYVLSYSSPSDSPSNSWSVISHGYGAYSETKHQNKAQGPWKIQLTPWTFCSPLYSQNRIHHVFSAISKYSFTKFIFYKNVAVSNPLWSKSNLLTAPASLRNTLSQAIKIDFSQEYYYFRLFFLSEYLANHMAPSGVTVSQIWNPYIFIEYRDNTSKRECKIKYFPISFSNIRNTWTSSSYIFNVNNDFLDIDIIQAIGVEFRCLDSSCPQVLLNTYVDNRMNGSIEEYLSIDKFEFGKGNVILPDYQDSNGDPRSSGTFYFMD